MEYNDAIKKLNEQLTSLEQEITLEPMTGDEVGTPVIGCWPVQGVIVKGTDKNGQEREHGRIYVDGWVTGSWDYSEEKFSCRYNQDENLPNCPSESVCSEVEGFLKEFAENIGAEYETRPA